MQLTTNGSLMIEEGSFAFQSYQLHESLRGVGSIGATGYTKYLREYQIKSVDKSFNTTSNAYKTFKYDWVEPILSIKSMNIKHWE